MTTKSEFLSFFVVIYHHGNSKNNNKYPLIRNSMNIIGYCNLCISRYDFDITTIFSETLRFFQSSLGTCSNNAARF